MKKHFIAAAALVASLASASAFAENFKGAYVGVNVGANAFQSGYTQTSAGGNGGAEKPNSGATLFNYGLFAGYGHTFGQFYVGGELLFSLNSGEASYNSTNSNNSTFANAKIKENFSFGPSIRLGALIAPKTLAFVKFGGIGTQLKVDTRPFSLTGASTPATSYKKTVWGYSFGAGLETLVTTCISVRADYTFNGYPTKTFAIPNTNAGNANQGKISARDNIFRVGLAYNF